MDLNKLIELRHILCKLASKRYNWVLDLPIISHSHSKLSGHIFYTNYISRHAIPVLFFCPWYPFLPFLIRRPSRGTPLSTNTIELFQITKALIVRPLQCERITTITRNWNQARLYVTNIFFQLPVLFHHISYSLAWDRRRNPKPSIRGILIV